MTKRDELSPTMLDALEMARPHGPMVERLSGHSAEGRRGDPATNGRLTRLKATPRPGKTGTVGHRSTGSGGSPADCQK
jgi:hypothetical protein